jgi:2-methylisocitrate lyase-like PEP mutase family enzyme
MHLGETLRAELLQQKTGIEPFIGFFDCFSATIASQFSANLFFSGFGFSASHYGLPDNGYITWSDVVQAVWRVRQILPAHRLLVDIDDGYADTLLACRVSRELEAMGVAMVMLEDQGRPRRCGHADGQIVIPLNDYIAKLNAVLDHRQSLCVLARTDASGDEIYRRVEAIQKTEADAVLVDGITSIEILRRVRSLTDKPVAFNQIAGGKSPHFTAHELRAEGVQVHIYSTPMLFAAQAAMRTALQEIFDADGRLPEANGDAPGVKNCTALLEQNLASGPVRLAEALESHEAVLQAEHFAVSE